MESQLHWHLEKCDRYGGTQLFLDPQSGFGEIALQMMHLLQSEVPRSSHLLFSIDSHHSNLVRSLSLLIFHLKLTSSRMKWRR